MRNIEVFVRIRGGELCPTSCVQSDGRRLNVIAPLAKSIGTPSQPSLLKESSQSFTFEGVLQGENQTQVYRVCGLALVDNVLAGQNACLFAYGQTGSGKTHSMLGGDGGHSYKRLDGVIPQLADDLFRRISRQETDIEVLTGSPSTNLSTYQVNMSYIEVFEGRAYDLLHHDGRHRIPTHHKGNSDASAGPLVFSLGTSQRVCSTNAIAKLIALGSTRRTTRSTGMNEHSSRSHAIACIQVTHRWIEEQGSRKVRSRTSHVSLVDLAGSENTAEAHNGIADTAGCSINTDLLALGQVCNALATGEKHIPYRDSLLTYLLEPLLCGRSCTRLLACVSSRDVRFTETVRTLKFAERVSAIKTKDMTNVETVESEIHDPLNGDVEDPDQTVMRRVAWIDVPGFGDIFARCAGDVEGPLILYVHGSGPRNSSLFWNFLVEQVATSLPGLYHVAIDCPGYGRSLGQKQSIRSYPGDLLRKVVQSLGKSRAFCLVGCSQGACAVMNAAVEVPSISKFLAVCHPVGHDVRRYQRVSQPTLLAFDRSDPGHPISVGRQMRRHLQSAMWREYDSNDEPEWLETSFSRSLIQLFLENGGGRQGTKIGSDEAKANCTDIPELTLVCGGLNMWHKAHGREYRGWEVGQNGGFHHPDSQADRTNKSEGDDSYSNDQSSQWVAEFDSGTSRVLYRHLVTNEIQHTRPFGCNVQFLDKGAMEGAELPLFPEEGKSERDCADKIAKRTNELKDKVCSKCEATLHVGSYGRIARVKVCRHVLCSECVQIYLKYHQHCPVCALRCRKCDLQRDEELERLLPRTSAPAPSRLSTTYEADLVIEVGNRCSDFGSSNRLEQTTYVRVVGPRRQKGVRGAIRCVEFNINPSYPKPTSRIDAPSGPQKEFALTRSLGFTYPCFVTIHFSEGMGVSPVFCENFTQMDCEEKSVRIALELPSHSDAKRSKTVVKRKAACHYVTKNGDGWVRYGDPSTAAIEYTLAQGEGKQSALEESQDRIWLEEEEYIRSRES